MHKHVSKRKLKPTIKHKFLSWYVKIISKILAWMEAALGCSCIVLYKKALCLHYKSFGQFRFFSLNLHSSPAKEIVKSQLQNSNQMEPRAELFNNIGDDNAPRYVEWMKRNACVFSRTSKDLDNVDNQHLTRRNDVEFAADYRLKLIKEPLLEHMLCDKCLSGKGE